MNSVGIYRKSFATQKWNVNYEKIEVVSLIIKLSNKRSTINMDMKYNADSLDFVALKSKWIPMDNELRHL